MDHVSYDVRYQEQVSVVKCGLYDIWINCMRDPLTRSHSDHIYSCFKWTLAAKLVLFALQVVSQFSSLVFTMDCKTTETSASAPGNVA